MKKSTFGLIAFFAFSIPFFAQKAHRCGLTEAHRLELEEKAAHRDDSKITSATELLVNDLIFPSATSPRFWQVTPMNSWAFCGTPSAPQNFLASAASAAEMVEKTPFSIQIQPNPTEKGASRAQLFVETDALFEADLTIRSTDGQLLFSKKSCRFSPTEKAADLPSERLGPGLFFVE